MRQLEDVIFYKRLSLSAEIFNHNFVIFFEISDLK